MKPKAEYGDFQTPGELAQAVCRVVLELGIRPAALLEPTCGTGSFLRAGLTAFGPGIGILAFDINADYVHTAAAEGARVVRGDFFKQDWPSVVREMSEPLLVLGNPPWVTSAALGAMGGGDRPARSNFQGHNGLDAITGKSNFDVSEYMLIRLAEALEGRRAALAMLAKASVVRRVLAYCWKRGLQMDGCHIFPIDSRRWFGVTVEACLFVALFRGGDASCIVHDELRADSPGTCIGYRDGVLVSDVEAFERWRSLGGECPYRWRSGIKHDCAKVMEFREKPGGFENGLGETVDIEGDLLYPLLKSSALAGSTKAGRRWMLVPQRATGEDTARIAAFAPKTWQYLTRHGARLDQRASAVYRRRPRFAVFGVGPYSFAPWKVAISGLYKKLQFSLVGPHAGKPVVFDDTCYFLAFDSREEAAAVHAALSSEPARQFYRSRIFWDAKRPITVEVLRQLNIGKLLEG